MRDFPIFTTEFGISSLTLREIPYKKTAFICIRDVQEGGFDQHLEECVKFCKIAGAEQVYATGHDCLEAFPLYTSVLEMCGPVSPEGCIACLFPVTEQTVGRWREIYNEKMRSVDNARTLEKRDEQELLSSSGIYFVHQQRQLLGIGWLEDGKLLALVSLEPGAGERVLRTLMSTLSEETMTLEVASTNLRAIRLYEKMGFIKSREISRWYDVT